MEIIWTNQDGNWRLVRYEDGTGFWEQGTACGCGHGVTWEGKAAPPQWVYTELCQWVGDQLTAKKAA